MPYCPNCELEYRPGITRCPDCGEPILDGDLPPPAPRPPRTPIPLPSSDTESVLLCTVPDPTEADIVHALLAEAGISSLVRRQGPLTGELATIADGATLDYALIFVTKNRLQEAKQVLANMQSTSVQWPPGMEPSDEEEDDDL
jgi:hypothetical protein